MFLVAPHVNKDQQKKNQRSILSILLSPYMTLFPSGSICNPDGLMSTPSAAAISLTNMVFKEALAPMFAITFQDSFGNLGINFVSNMTLNIDASTIQVLIAANYLLNCSITIATSTSVKNITLTIFVDGEAKNFLAMAPPSTTEIPREIPTNSVFTLSITGIINLSPGSTVQLVSINSQTGWNYQTATFTMTSIG